MLAFCSDLSLVACDGRPGCGNALATTIDGLHKTEMLYRPASWQAVEAAEPAFRAGMAGPMVGAGADGFDETGSDFPAGKRLPGCHMSLRVDAAMPTSSQRFPPRLLPLGDSAWTVEFGERIDPSIHARVMGLGAALEKVRTVDPLFAQVLDIVPTFRSLTVHYDPLPGRGMALREALRQLAEGSGEATLAGRRWCLPACFDDDFAPDLPVLAERGGLSRTAVMQALLDCEFRVYMIGFMPGFPYLGDLPEALRAPRRRTPRQAVPAGSIAVAGQLCGVYPWASPGGWHLLGRTPVPLFVAGDVEPSLLAAGDSLRWRAVSRSAYEEVAADLRHGRRTRRDFEQARETV